MRNLVNYFRSLFCKHEWGLIFDGYIEEIVSYPVTKTYKGKVYGCKKCGKERICKE